MQIGSKLLTTLPHYHEKCKMYVVNVNVVVVPTVKVSVLDSTLVKYDAGRVVVFGTDHAHYSDN